MVLGVYTYYEMIGVPERANQREIIAAVSCCENEIRAFYGNSNISPKEPVKSHDSLGNMFVAMDFLKEIDQTLLDVEKRTEYDRFLLEMRLIESWQEYLKAIYRMGYSIDSQKLYQLIAYVLFIMNNKQYTVPNATEKGVVRALSLIGRTFDIAIQNKENSVSVEDFIIAIRECDELLPEYRDMISSMILNEGYLPKSRKQR